VTIQTGSRILSQDEEERVRQRVSLHGNLIIQSVRHDVKPNQQDEQTSTANLRILTKTIRSGQVVHYDGSILLLGDINPGGCLICTGDIYVMGSLRGLAHAGSEGDREAIIAASVMYPTQLRIADVISRPPEEWDEQAMELDFAYLEDNEMAIEKISQLHKVRPNKETIF
ncbi:MAG: septum site-determining protein MinC, partial [Bacilli bacterium]